MSGHRGRCLIGLVVALTLVGATQLHFLLLQMTSEVQPCSKLRGISMTRHPHNCSMYVLCVVGQAVRMPPCPRGQVWSTRAVRCVTFDSHFNDCPHVHTSPYSAPANGKAPSGITAMKGFASYTIRPLITRKKVLSDKAIDLIEANFPGHPCVFVTTYSLLPHPQACHWFYNCSMSPLDERWASVEPLTQECPYPKLFSLTKRTCLHYTKVSCGERPEFKTPCDYRANSCTGLHCRDCQARLAGCEGLPDGLHPFPTREWTPWFVICKDERTLEQNTCDQKTPIFSPTLRACVSSEWVPKQYGGTQAMCFGRSDGFHPNDQGVCNRFFHCYHGEFINAYECERGMTFNPETWTCSLKSTTPPCGNKVRPHQLERFCAGLIDGYYADPYGRCSLYIQCKRGRLLAYLKCKQGAFNPISKVCESTLNLPAPCGMRPNHCQARPDGVYPNVEAKCSSSMICRSSFVSSIDECQDDLVFDYKTKSCRSADLTPPPCGIAPSCHGKVNGRYPAMMKGCEHFYLCLNGRFDGYERCHVYRGGYLFNPRTGKCDFPKNICPPCGTKSQCQSK